MRRHTIVAAATVALVVVGLRWGVQPDNLHNGLIAVSFAVVGELVLRRLADQAEARLFLAAGAAQSVIFLGRQVGGAPGSAGGVAEWMAWLGGWPLPLVLVLVGATIMCFPDGHLPGRIWRVALRVMAALGIALATMSALWPVDYGRTGIVQDPPFLLPGAEVATDVYDVARPVCFLAFQLLWLACVVHRWSRADRDEARQLRWLGTAVGASVVVLVAGLVVTGSPRAGLLTVALIPVAAGVAIVESAYVALVRDVRSMSARIVSAQDDARRRIERDLHDGAQHRLVVLGMELGRLVERAERTGDPELARSALAAREQLLEATAELRELARGIHPTVLTQDGLASALDMLADGSSLPVRLSVDLRGRGSSETEAAAYFVVSECLANAVRHSGATRVTVRVAVVDGTMSLVVSDDGRGGAHLRSGLQNLVDRVSALDGTLVVDSPHGVGTTITVELPC